MTGISADPYWWQAAPPQDFHIEHWPDRADVVIIGGGMVGMLAWFALQSAGVERLRILDQSQPGHEGPWLNYARMQTLRSPKQLECPHSVVHDKC